MASPQLQIFHLYNQLTGVPVTGQTIGPGGIHFEYYQDEAGTPLDQPTISEIGGGAYGFTPTFVTNHCIDYTIVTGSDVTPSRVSGFIRPEEYNLDGFDPTILERLLDHAEGKWQIFVSGPDANKMVLYDRNGSVLLKFALTDRYGVATAINPFARTPEVP